MTRPTIAELARMGDLEALYARFGGDPSSREDREIYAHFLHAAGADDPHAQHIVDRITETDTFEDGARLAAWELAVHFLAGSDGRPVDFALAVARLDDALFACEIDEIDAGIDVEAIAERLSADARIVFRRYLEIGVHVGRVRARIARTRRLIEIGAPAIVLDHERGLLREALDRLVSSPGSAREEATIAHARALLARP